jgi:chromosome segregation ATPase
LQRKTADAEKNVSVLAARLEKEHRAESAANNAIEKELKKKIAGLEKKLQEYDVLLENRNLEITALQTRAGDAEKQRAAAEARIEEERKQWSEAQHSLERDFTGKISEFEKRLEASDQLLKARDAELAESKARAIEAAESAATARAQLQQNNSEISSARKGTDELQGKISSLEGQLKESGTLLKARNSEIAALRAQASESQKKITELQEQFDAATQASAKGQKAGGELNTRIATLEQKLEETEKLLEARAAEIAALQGKSTPENGARGANAAVAGGNRKGFSNERREDKEDKEDDVRKRLHQFQYAVKYLEDELKEKDRLISLMTKKQAQVTPVAGKNPTDEDLKKRVHQLEQSVKYLENQNKEKDGLLSLMAKRNRELADLKSKAEERLEAMEGNTDGTQTTKSQPDVESER